MSLFASLTRAGNNLAALNRGLSTVQNNLANASTPGYARQRSILEARPFDLAAGLTGGVAFAGVQSQRDVYSEQAVQLHANRQAAAAQVAATLQQIDGTLGDSPETGVRGAINRLFDSFSDWTLAPEGSQERQAVITRADDVAQTFRQTFASLAQTSKDLHQSARDTVTDINRLVRNLSLAADAYAKSGNSDAGAEASLYQGLEELSGLVDVTVSRNGDGSFRVLLGGQVPLVLGNTAFEIRAMDLAAGADSTYPGAPPTTQIVDSEGNDITALISGGTLGGLIESRNSILSSLIGSGEQLGSLNQLAKKLADDINSVLLSGEVTDPPSEAPVALFNYGESPANSLTRNPTATAANLAAIQTAPDLMHNGIPAQLSALRTTTDPAYQIDGLSYGEFVIRVEADLGVRYTSASSTESLERRLLVQSQNLRQEASGVSLEEEAVMLLEFQRSYQAATRVINVIDEMTESVLAMLH